MQQNLQSLRRRKCTQWREAAFSPLLVGQGPRAAPSPVPPGADPLAPSLAAAPFPNSPGRAVGRGNRKGHVVGSPVRVDGARRGGGAVFEVAGLHKSAVGAARASRGQPISTAKQGGARDGGKSGGGRTAHRAGCARGRTRPRLRASAAEQSAAPKAVRRRTAHEAARKRSPAAWSTCGGGVCGRRVCGRRVCGRRVCGRRALTMNCKRWPGTLGARPRQRCRRGRVLGCPAADSTLPAHKGSLFGPCSRRWRGPANCVEGGGSDGVATPRLQQPRLSAGA
jgi:hypothetical protein